MIVYHMWWWRNSIKFGVHELSELCLLLSTVACIRFMRLCVHLHVCVLHSLLLDGLYIARHTNYTVTHSHNRVWNNEYTHTHSPKQFDVLCVQMYWAYQRSVCVHAHRTHDIESKLKEKRQKANSHEEWNEISNTCTSISQRTFCSVNSRDHCQDKWLCERWISILTLFLFNAK